MARTRDEITNDAAKYVGSPDDAEVTGIAVSGLMEGIDTLNLRHWNFMLVTSGFALSTNTADYYIPDVKAVRHVNLKDGTTTRAVGYTDPKSFYLEHPSRGTGDITTYTAVPSGTSGVIIRFDATLSSTVTWPSGEVHYYNKIAYPSAGGTINVPPEVESLLVNFTKAYLAEYYDAKKVNGPRSRFVEGYRQLRANQMQDEILDWSE